MGVTIGELVKFNMAHKRVVTFKGISILRFRDNKMNLYLGLKGHRSKLTHQKEIKFISCVVLQKQIKKEEKMTSKMVDKTLKMVYVSFYYLFDNIIGLKGNKF